MSKTEVGVLCPISALPGGLGVGDFSDRSAYLFVDTISDKGYTYWQILPITPIHIENSPYSPKCMFGIDLVYLDTGSVIEVKECDYNLAREEKRAKVSELVEKYSNESGYLSWVSDNKHWVIDLSNHNPWEVTPEECLVLQYVLHKQWFRLKKYANSKGVRIIGDMPLLCSSNSVEQKVMPEMFLPLSSWEAGCPPDNFNDQGQRWQLLIFNSKEREKVIDFHIAKFKYYFDMYDEVRLDHFPGYTDVMAINPSGNFTHFYFPGEDIFKKVLELSNRKPMIAEDLGRRNYRVDRLLNYISAYSTAVALDYSWALHYSRRSKFYSYSSTHDFDPLLARMKEYGYVDPHDVIKKMIRDNLVTSICTVQDLLKLGSDYRINKPGIPTGQWVTKFSITHIYSLPETRSL